MSDLNKNIVRNDVTWTLEMSPFSKKSPHKGKSFPTPVVNEANFEDFVKWMGKVDLISYLNSSLRVDFMNIYTDNIDDVTGLFNSEKWAVDAADFTAGVTRLSAVLDQLEELFDKQSEIVENDNYGASVKNEAGEDVYTPEAMELDNQIREINKKIRGLKVLKADLEKKIGEKAAKRKATKEANELKAKQAADAAKAGSLQPA